MPLYRTYAGFSSKIGRSCAEAEIFRRTKRICAVWITILLHFPPSDGRLGSFRRRRGAGPRQKPRFCAGARVFRVAALGSIGFVSPERHRPSGKFWEVFGSGPCHSAARGVAERDARAVESPRALIREAASGQPNIIIALLRLQPPRVPSDGVSRSARHANLRVVRAPVRRLARTTKSGSTEKPRKTRKEFSAKCPDCRNFLCASSTPGAHG
jgi:hypothetical protein